MYLIRDFLYPLFPVFLASKLIFIFCSCLSQTAAEHNRGYFCHLPCLLPQSMTKIGANDVLALIALGKTVASS